MIIGFVILGVLVACYSIVMYFLMRERQKTRKELLDLISKMKGH